MRVGRSITAGVQAKVVVLTADKEFEEAVRAAFGASGQLGLDVVKGTLSSRDQIDVDGSTLVIVDVDAGDEAELQALENLMTRLGNWPPVVAVTSSFEATTARRLVQMRVADFLDQAGAASRASADLRTGR